MSFLEELASVSSRSMRGKKDTRRHGEGNEFELVNQKGYFHEDDRRIERERNAIECIINKGKDARLRGVHVNVIAMVIGVTGFRNPNLFWGKKAKKMHGATNHSVICSHL